jgi:undecaprenyl-diphosphatase
MALGLLHGPTELLPVSSSGHTTLVPWLAGWPYTELDPTLRKSFEVALHAGTAAALLLRAPVSGPCGGPAFLLPAVIPPALGGYTLGGTIERRLGTPLNIASGLLAGSAAMLGADMHARNSSSRTADRRASTNNSTGAQSTNQRSAADAGVRDGLAIGLAQALALMPGISRSGAALTAARIRGFSKHDADRLSWMSGLPVIAGAAGLQGARLARAGTLAELRLPLAVGMGAAFLSTLTSARLLGLERRTALLGACSVYRCVLALVAIRRVRDNTRQHAH